MKNSMHAAMQHAEPQVLRCVIIGILLSALLGGFPSAVRRRVDAADAVHSAAERIQQERPGVSPGVGEPGVTFTRGGDVIWEVLFGAHEPGSGLHSRTMLTEDIEIVSVKSGQGWWPSFLMPFASSTGQALLDAMPSSAAAKKGKVIVVFDVRRDGKLNGAVSVEHSSGDPSVDAAAQLAVAKSAPFHELPQEFQRAVAQFRVTFAYNHPHPIPPSGGGAR